MPFSLRSIILFSSLIAASPLVWGPGESTPPGVARADPVVTPAPLLTGAPDVEAEPDDWAVPALLVPGALRGLATFPAPLGSLPELFRPAAFPGPGGTPLMAAGPAPWEPAVGEPVTLLLVPLVLLVPLAAPPAPPLPPALPPLPPLCASEMAGMVRMAKAVVAAIMADLGIVNSPFLPNGAAPLPFPRGTIANGNH
jgi:hypothetical protein